MENYESPEIKSLSPKEDGGYTTMGVPGVSPIFLFVGIYFVAVNRTYVYNTSPSGGGECTPYQGCEYGDSR